MEDVKYFYRVHIRLEDGEPGSDLAFDFKDMIAAMQTATILFKACDIVKVWIEIVENEVSTTNSPMWRCYEKH